MSPLLKIKKGVNMDQLKKYCCISGLVAFCIMIFTYLCHSNSLFFGDQTVLRMDLYHQYGPLYAELYDRIVNGYSLIYSWTSGLGGGFLGNLFNYCCSPFALIIFLFGHKNMPEAIAVMILLKAVFSSVSFTYYINKTNKRTDVVSVAFGVLYAFCGFFVAYSWNIMWLDAMSIFPLVMFGVEKIIEERKPALFVFSLTYTMITNYYMAYMVCVLSVIYFLYFFLSRYTFSSSLKPIVEKSGNQTGCDLSVSTDEHVFASVTETSASEEQTEADRFEQDASGAEAVVFAAEQVEAVSSFQADKKSFTVFPAEKTEKKTIRKKEKGQLKNNRFWNTGWMFACSAVVCFLLSAFALLPVYFCLQTSSATSASFPDLLKTYFNVFDFIANHLPSVSPTIRSSGEIVLPNVYCGLLSVMLLPFYFLSSKISGRKKIASLCVLVIFYVSFSVNYLNFIWHGFHFPNDLPYRFSFAYSFFILSFAYQALLNIGEFTRKQFIAAGMAITAFAVLLDKIGSENVDRYSIILTAVLAVIYVIIGGYYTSPQYVKKSVVYLLVFTVIVEICFANTGKYTMSQSKTNYTSDYDSYRQISELTQKDDDEPFYRTELTKLRARMDPCWYGYHGVSTFSSMAYEHTAHLMEKMGLFGNDINSYTYYPQTPVFNSFFSIRYLYDNTDMLSDGDTYSLVASNETYDAYRYNYYLPLAFSVSKTVQDWNIAYSDPFDVQNDLMAVCTGVGDCLIHVDATGISTSNMSGVSLESVNNGTTFNVSRDSGSGEYTVTVYIDVEEEGEYYVYAGSTKLSSIKITADDFSYNYVSSSIQPFTIGVGKQPAGGQIAVEYHVDSANASANLTFTAARLNEESFLRAYRQIRNNGVLSVSSFKDTHFAGKINVTNDDGFLFTSIPYDESWEIKLDGKLLKYYTEETDADSTDMVVKVGGGLIGFNVSAGEHTVEFTYKAKGLKEGLMLSSAGAVILLIILLQYLLKRRKKETTKMQPPVLPASSSEEPSSVLPITAEEQKMEENDVSGESKNA